MLEFRKIRTRIVEDLWYLLGLGGAILFSAISTLWGIGKVQRSEYYASIAMSMSKSFSNFFFGALDPSGAMTLDKIPGSYWVPAIFVRIFGFSTWAITVPNALAAIALTFIVAKTGRMLFGKTAAVISASIVATTPIITAVSRSNQPQTFFLLTLSLSGYFAAKALILESRKYLIISGAYIALAFHAYMLEAWAVWPALIAAWFFTSRTLRQKLLDLLFAGSISLFLSLSWILIVWFIPKSHRPYIGGTYHNNPFEMVFGYNGLGRFNQTSHALSSSTDDPIFRSFTPPFGGQSGFGRLFSSAVAGQIAWMLPAAFIAVVVLVLLKIERKFIFFYAIWLATFFLMFSFVSGIHQFYTSSLAIPVAILIAGAITRAEAFGKQGTTLILVSLGIISSFYIATKYKGFYTWSLYMQALFAVIAIAMLASARSKVVTNLFIILSIVFVPGVWAYDAHNHTNSINPIAGSGEFGFGGPGGFRSPGGSPDQFRGPDRTFNRDRPNQGNFPPRDQLSRGNFNRDNLPPQGNGGNFGQVDNSAAITYLEKNRAGAKYLLATFGAQSAASFITSTGENVLPIGGFDGSDPTPTLKKFIALVRAGDVKYVLDGGMGGPNGNSGSSTSIRSWVSAHCSVDGNSPTRSTLYVCSKG